MRKNHNRIDGITRERIRNRGSNRTGVVRAFVMRLHRKLSLITSIASVYYFTQYMNGFSWFPISYFGIYFINKFYYVINTRIFSRVIIVFESQHRFKTENGLSVVNKTR